MTAAPDNESCRSPLNFPAGLCIIEYISKERQLPARIASKLQRVAGKETDMGILFINACVRENSRTKRLADRVIAGLDGDVTELRLEDEALQPLDHDLLMERDRLIGQEAFDDPMFRYARQFAEADEIVIAAPYWELSFPAMLKTYIELISVTGVTFGYDDGRPAGLCKGKRLIYVTTAGGPVMADFGYPYIKALAETFYGIPEIVCYRAENLDVDGMDVESILRETEAQIDRDLKK